MFLSKNVIAAFVPCPKCQRPATVHFPKGGPRKNAPYLVCPDCGNQQNQKRDYFIDHAVNTLPEFIGKYGETAHTSAFAEALEKCNPVIDNNLLVRMHPIEDEPEQVDEQSQTKEPGVKKQAVTYDEQGNIIDEQSANDKAGQPTTEPDGTVLMVVVLVAAVVITGGYFVVKKINQRKERAND